MRRRLLGFAMLWLVVWPARAEEHTAAELVDRVAEALGGCETLAAIEGYHLEAAAEGIGLTGTSTVHTLFPDHQRSELSLPPLTLLTVHVGDRAWLRDHNGHVVAFNPQQLADNVTGLYIDAFRPWLDPHDPRIVSLDTSLEIDGKLCPVLRIAAPGGNPWWVAIDPDAFLPVRYSHLDESGIGREVMELADYREVEGIQVPFQVVSYNDALAENRTIFRVTSLLLRPPDNPGLFERPTEVSDVTFPLGSSQVAGPMTYRSGHAFIDVHVIGKGAAVDGTFLLDTGSTTSLLDRGVLDALGLEPAGDLEGLAVGGTMEMELVEVPFLRVGGVLLEAQVLGTSTFAEAMSEQLGVEVIGLLGYDFFSRLAVTMDFAGGRCVLHPAGAWQPPDEGAVLTIDFVDQQPVVHAVLDDSLTGRWRLDTGADVLAVHGPAAATWKLTESHPVVREIQAAGIGGTARAMMLRADSFRIGPYEVSRPLVLVPSDPGGVLGAEAIAGNLGTSILERFVMTVDFGRRQLHLVPGPLFGQQDRVQVAGFEIGWVGTRVQVIEVAPGSAAEQQGLRAGQEVLRLAGRLAVKWPQSELERLIAGELGDSVVVVVREGGRRKRIKLDI